jgi:hypothetical protein
VVLYIYKYFVTEMKKWWNTAPCEDRDPVSTGVIKRQL